MQPPITPFAPVWKVSREEHRKREVIMRDTPPPEGATQQDYFDRGTQSTRVNNLIRMNQGKMMGIDFDIDKSWIGASVAPHD